MLLPLLKLALSSLLAELAARMDAIRRPTSFVVSVFVSVVFQYCDLLPCVTMIPMIPMMTKMTVMTPVVLAVVDLRTLFSMTCGFFVYLLVNVQAAHIACARL